LFSNMIYSRKKETQCPRYSTVEYGVQE